MKSGSKIVVQLQKLAALLLKAQGRRAVVWKIGGKEPLI